MVKRKIKIRLLHIQKNNPQTEQIATFLQTKQIKFAHKVTYTRVPNILVAKKYLLVNKVDVIVFKVRELSQLQQENIRWLREMMPNKTIVVLDNSMSKESFKIATTNGADDCLAGKNLNLNLLLRSILLCNELNQNQCEKNSFDHIKSLDNLLHKMTSTNADYDSLLELTNNFLQIKGSTSAVLFAFTDGHNRIKKMAGTEKSASSEDCSHIPTYGTSFWKSFKKKLLQKSYFKLDKKNKSIKKLDESELNIFFPFKTKISIVLPIKTKHDVYGFILIAFTEFKTLTESIQAFVKISAKFAALILERYENDNNFAQLIDTLRLLNKILRHDILNNLSVVYGVLNLYTTSKDDKLIADSQDAIDKSINFLEKMKDYEISLQSLTALKAIELRPQFEKAVKNIPLTHTITGNCTVLADDGIASIINNIIGNAVEHSRGDNIDIVMREDNTEAIIEISNNGDRIPEKYKKLIFNEGFAKGSNSGTGLGLFIVKEIITRYKGKISVLDNDPRGTLFRIRLQIPTE